MASLADGYEFVTFAIEETIDNNEKMYTAVLAAVRRLSTVPEKTRAQRAGEDIYRIITLKLHVRSVGPLPWHRPGNSPTFADELVRALMGSPFDENGEMWTEIGKYYLNKIAEGN